MFSSAPHSRFSSSSVTPNSIFLTAAAILFIVAFLANTARGTRNNGVDTVETAGEGSGSTKNNASHGSSDSDDEQGDAGKRDGSAGYSDDQIKVRINDDGMWTLSNQVIPAILRSMGATDEKPLVFNPFADLKTTNNIHYYENHSSFDVRYMGYHQSSQYAYWFVEDSPFDCPIFDNEDTKQTVSLGFHHSELTLPVPGEGAFVAQWENDEQLRIELDYNGARFSTTLLVTLYGGNCILPTLEDFAIDVDIRGFGGSLLLNVARSEDEDRVVIESVAEANISFDDVDLDPEGGLDRFKEWAIKKGIESIYNFDCDDWADCVSRIANTELTDGRKNRRALHEDIVGLVGDSLENLSGLGTNLAVNGSAIHFSIGLDDVETTDDHALVTHWAADLTTEDAFDACASELTQFDNYDSHDFYESNADLNFLIPHNLTSKFLYRLARSGAACSEIDLSTTVFSNTVSAALDFFPSGRFELRETYAGVDSSNQTLVAVLPFGMDLSAVSGIAGLTATESEEISGKVVMVFEIDLTCETGLTLSLADVQIEDLVGRIQFAQSAFGSVEVSIDDLQSAINRNVSSFLQNQGFDNVSLAPRFTELKSIDAFLELATISIDATRIAGSLRVLDEIPSECTERCLDAEDGLETCIGYSLDEWNEAQEYVCQGYTSSENVEACPETYETVCVRNQNRFSSFLADVCGEHDLWSWWDKPNCESGDDNCVDWDANACFDHYDDNFARQRARL